MFSDIIKIAGKSAPLIGTLLGGPAGAAVGELIAGVAGVEPDKLEKHMASLSPEDQAALLIKTQETRAIELDALKAQHISMMEIAKAEEATKQEELRSKNKFLIETRPWLARNYFKLVVCLFIMGFLLILADASPYFEIKMEMVKAVINLMEEPLWAMGTAVAVWFGGRSIEHSIRKRYGKQEK